MYDLENRLRTYAIEIRRYLKKLPENYSIREDKIQLVKSSGSVGANYIEANEALSKKDLIFRLKISRKEAKESEYWLQLILESYSIDSHLQEAGMSLLKETKELRYILSSIINKVKN